MIATHHGLFFFIKKKKKSTQILKNGILHIENRLLFSKIASNVSGILIKSINH